MQIFKNRTQFDFMGKRRLFGWLSGVAVVASLALIIFEQPKFGIDFAGGTEIQVRFVEPGVTAGKIRSVLKKLGLEGADVVAFGEGEEEFLIRLQKVSTLDDTAAARLQKHFGKALDAKVLRVEVSPGGDKVAVYADKPVPVSDLEKAAVAADLRLAQRGQDVLGQSDDAGKPESERRRCESATCTWTFKDQYVYELNLEGVSEQVMDALRATPWGKGAVKMRSEWVGAKVGAQLRDAGIQSIVYSLIFIMIYIALRFDMRFAPGAVAALIHDVIITLGVFTVARVEVTLATVAALLTIVGYSLNDTIVVFDRIRDNLQATKREKLENLINVSVNETLSRTILTSLTTLMAVVVLLALGWKTSLRDFSFALTVGVVVGTYSSVFIASPVVVLVDRWFFQKKA